MIAATRFGAPLPDGGTIGVTAPASPYDMRSELERTTGCRFHPRCPVAIEACRTIEPPLELTAAGHRAACLLQPSIEPSERRTNGGTR